MRISAPGDCNQALRQSSGALGEQIAPFTVANDPAATAFGFTSITPIDAGAIVFNKSFWYRSSKMRPIEVVRFGRQHVSHYHRGDGRAVN
jgi:hypothetical protein